MKNFLFCNIMNMSNNDFKTNITKKKNKNYKFIVNLYKKVSNLINHLEFLFKNKFILQDFYIDKMQLLNDIYIKINNYEELNDKKKNKQNKYREFIK